MNPNFFTIAFWFSQYSPPITNIFRAFWAAFAVCLVLALIFKIYRSVKRREMTPWVSRLVNKSAILSWVMGFWGLALMFFSYQNIPYLSSRIMYLLWLIVLVKWLGLLGYYLLKHYPFDKLAYEQKRRSGEVLK